MKCPIDGATLVISERSGVEIDYCPTCRGVWLDRGELDKILERSGDGSRTQASGQTQDRGMRSKKRSSLLSELFDF